MQATLLSIAIALILALVAALVGPHFVDWNKYRGRVRDPGQPDDRPAGARRRPDRRPAAADAVAQPVAHRHRAPRRGRLAAGAPAQHRVLARLARARRVEGDRRDRLEGAEISIALDRNGRLEWPAPSVGFDPEAISIERLDIRDSRALLADAASGYGVVLDKLDFKGELRTLSGPVKGPGIVLCRRTALSLSDRGEPCRRRARCACGSISIRSTGP